MLTKEIAELTSLLERLEADKREADKQAMTSGHTLRQLDSEMARTRERLATYERELQQCGCGTFAAGAVHPGKAVSYWLQKNSVGRNRAQIAAAQENLAALTCRSRHGGAELPRR